MAAPAPYADALSELATALGVSGSALIKASLEAAARRLAEHPEHRGAAQQAAANFVEASAAVTRRAAWASLPGIELPTTATVEAA